MKLNHLDQAIIEQNSHWDNNSYEQAYNRLHNQESIDDLKLDEIQIITGIRRCGKSTLMQTLINHLMTSISSKSILYINFDDPNYTSICNDAANLYDVITTTEKLTNEKVTHLFLDEIQNMNAWEKYVKSMYDSKRFKKIVVSGSNADLLNSDYASLLTGRYLETRLYPMRYQELLLNNNIKGYFQLVKQKPLALQLLDQMLQFGGFPRVNCVETDSQRRRILKGYYETILLKDCVKNHHVRNVNMLINLAHYLISNAAAIYSYNSLSKAVQSNENTVKDFIRIYESAYLIHEIKKFSYSLKQQARAKKKSYCIDNGFLTTTSFKFSSNMGKLLENLVYTELQKSSNQTIYFYNENKECDFILHGEKQPIAIQVCYELNHENISREKNGLIAAMQDLSIPEGIIITYDQEEAFDENIKAIPFWKFFAFTDLSAL
jgi:predicted AAA+ superfamily ATPase